MQEPRFVLLKFSSWCARPKSWPISWHVTMLRPAGGGGRAGAGVRVGGVRGLVPQAEVVADLLARHHVAPRRRVVAGGAEVGVVQLRVRLGDVAAAGRDAGDAAPAGRA